MIYFTSLDEALKYTVEELRPFTGGEHESDSEKWALEKLESLIRSVWESAYELGVLNSHRA